ncbi:MAG: chemotaxis protein CheW [Chloroflexota bacterium]
MPKTAPVPPGDGTDGTAGQPVEITEEQRDAIFDRRAESLAAPPTPPRPADAFEALVFALGEERYAFRSSQVSEVRRIDQLTALPSAPAFVAGLVNVRGRIVPVLDLRPLLGVASEAEAPRAIVLVSVAEGDVAVLATDQPNVTWLRASELGALPPEAPTWLDPGCVRGVTPDLVTVLDGARLLADERLLVQEDM